MIYRVPQSIQDQEREECWLVPRRTGFRRIVTGKAPAAELLVQRTVVSAGGWQTSRGQRLAKNLGGPRGGLVGVGDVQAAGRLAHAPQRDIGEPGVIGEAGIVEILDADDVHFSPGVVLQRARCQQLET